MSIRSVTSAQGHFSAVPSANIQRSVFNRSHGHKTTLDSGYLVPVFVDEALPGDTFKLNSTFFTRLSTPIVPFMDNLFLETFYFSVPVRLLWDNWQKFNGERRNPSDSTDYVVPQVKSSKSTGFVVGSLADYFGLPTNVKAEFSVSALPFRAYNLIYNEWFRDENLIDSVPVETGDSDKIDNYSLLRRVKRHDYFTSALPWPQKGPGVELPLGGYARVVSNGETPSFRWVYQSGGSDVDKFVDGPLRAATFRGGVIADEDLNNLGNVTSPEVEFKGLNPTGGRIVSFAKSGLVADLTNATAVTINSLRQAFQLQKFFERDARGGTRYTEILRSHFGVISPDSRLQRPEYLGGSSTRINVTPVQQTSSTDDKSPQGNLAAFGVGADQHHGFTKSFVEHCIVIGLVNIRADLTYQQGINRMWSRRTRYDFYWPSFAHLGEQTILNKEIYAQGTAADDKVFGYQERYAEYRYFPSIITGKFRSTDPQSLDVWHLAQKFDSLPTLSKTFIEENPPIKRVLAVADEPQFLFDSFFDFRCTRPMPVYSVPGYVDHF